MIRWGCSSFLFSAAGRIRMTGGVLCGNSPALRAVPIAIYNNEGMASTAVPFFVFPYRLCRENTYSLQYVFGDTYSV